MAVTQIDGAKQIRAATITNAEISASAAIALSKLAEAVIQADGGQAHTADQPMGGFKLTGLGPPSAATDSATKGYVDSVAAGLDVHASVRAATTANITLTGTQSIDGVSVIANDRVLVKDQSAGQDNGIYVVAAGAWTRALDADVAAELSTGSFLFVEEGTVNGDTGWVLGTNAPITLGTTPLVFTQFSSAASITAGGGLLKTGNVIDVQATDASITVGADSIAVARDAAGAITLATGIKVNTDGTTIEISGNAIRIAATAAGSGLTGGGGSALAVNVGDGIEVNTDLVRVKLDGATLLRASAGLKVDVSIFVKRETPTGLVNGANTSYGLANALVAGSEEVFLNGILQEPGAGNDYTISGQTITYLAAPLTGDKIRVNYTKSV